MSTANVASVVASDAAKSAAKADKLPPVTRAQFMQDAAKAVEVTIGGANLLAALKVFEQQKDAVGPSLGYFLSGKTVIRVGDVPCEFQVGLNVTLIHSKNLPK